MRLKYHLITVILCIVCSYQGLSQSTTCLNAEPFCAGDDTLTFPNTTNAGMAESGPNYGCLVSQPNPTWYFLRIDQPGDLSFRIVQNSEEDLSGDDLDVDYIAYGPFDDTNVCGASLNGSKIVGCSYSLDAVEVFNLDGAQAGEFYILLITNFDNLPGFIQLQQSNSGNNAGTTDCSIVNTSNYCVGDVVDLDATTSSAVRYEWDKDGVLIPGETGPMLLGLEAPDATYNARSYDANNMIASRYEFILDFHEVPVAENVADQSICDDNNDGIGTFALSQFDPLVLGSQDPNEFVVRYYKTQDDANASENVLPTNYSNQVAYQQETLYARIENVNNTDCYDTTRFSIEVFDGAMANPIPDQIYCDDNNDGFGTFNFSDLNAIILGSQTAANYVISFHGSQIDAEADDNALPNSYVNSVAYQEETIFARIENNGNTECFDVTSFVIDVYNTPRPNTNPDDLILCEDPGDTDGVRIFDLTENEASIVNGETGVTISYFDNPSDPNTGLNAITDPSAFSNSSNPQIIYARVTNTESQCFSIVDFQLIVNAIPASVPISDFIRCENNTDGSAVFDLSSKNSEILNGQSPTQYNVSYHASQNDADNLAAPLANSFTNTSNPQQLFVAITNINTGCSISNQSFFIEVQEALEANSDGIPIVLEQCDDFGENDGFAQFDLSMVDAEVLDGQDASLYTVTYYLNQQDATANANPLNKQFENTVASQTLFARVDNPNLGDSQCYAITSLRLKVNRLPDFNLKDRYVLCTVENGTKVVPYPVLRTNLSSAQYSFQWTLDSQVITGQTGPSLIPTQTGTYSVLVTNLATQCSQTDTTEVFESSLPELSLEVTSRVFSESNEITATAIGSGVYEFSLDNGPWQTENVFQDVRAGRHTVKARDAQGCGFVSSVITVIGYLNYFTPNNDGYHDTWNIYGIGVQPDAKIYIFDRFGKLLKQITPSSPGWDGTFKGVEMPSSDYWFLIEYDEPSTGKRTEFRSHFTLKR